MAADEEARHRLHSRLDQVLGPADAGTLMTSLPPFEWDRVVTKDYLDIRLESLKNELVAEMHRTTNEAVHRMILAVIVAMIGTVLAATSLAFAAAPLV